ncbi:uncharacterized protein C8Q71DRAFT_120399 [Rhodofomes roseus]|uniref:Uncharacterized protein n=1 Tax=Rhodofomes roseus TaxID=34475 RepID=A0ABQ8KD08_9APHY|nr:uncharacterized protein C8Q71DRAFT_120399 [Rhodofomes roseus]KAH9835451.1 hypothetical protein C8Q71DRAFT_120399 [Rhodofomes roseus]
MLREAILLEGAVHPDGTVDTLSRADLLRCMKGKVKLAFKHANEIQSMFHHPASPACTAASCKQALSITHTQAVNCIHAASDGDHYYGSYYSSLLSTWSFLLDKWDASLNPPGAVVQAIRPCQACMAILRDIGERRNDTRTHLASVAVVHGR